MQLIHGRVPIELHTLRVADGPPLLLLHGLGLNSETWDDRVLDWSGGSVYALDFAGHGRSGRLRGGAYHPEYFLADADLALAEVGESCALLGVGIGAYVALMLAGARPDIVLGASLQAGPGLAGIGSTPDDEVDFDDIEGFERFIEEASRDFNAGTDPLVALCASDLRPLDYVASFATAATPLFFDETVGQSDSAPAWWAVALEANSGATVSNELSVCLAELASRVVRPAT